MCYLAVLSLPTLHQWDVFYNTDAKELADLDNLATRFVIPANVIALAALSALVVKASKSGKADRLGGKSK